MLLGRWTCNATRRRIFTNDPHLPAPPASSLPSCYAVPSPSPAIEVDSLLVGRRYGAAKKLPARHHEWHRLDWLSYDPFDQTQPPSPTTAAPFPVGKKEWLFGSRPGYTSFGLLLWRLTPPSLSYCKQLGDAELRPQTTVGVC
jgi:hypothetical protein